MKRLIAFGFCLLTLTFFIGCMVYDAAVTDRKVRTYAKDESIEAEIASKLIADETAKFLDVSAFCYTGNVYLVGEYETEKQKERAISIARGVNGVASITPYMLAKREVKGCGSTDNATITSTVKAKLIGDKEIWSTNVDVKTVQCNVVLLGVVGSKKEIDRAIAHTKSVKGVRGIKSFLRSIR
ncbi:MAG: BON domain-containing protein [Deltaproteobacteria bacterium]|nr:BON domain-containing protein [Deltaproteobacteria bacterium]